MGIDPFSAMAAATALDTAGSFLGQRFAMERQHAAQDFSSSQFANRYSTTVADMKRAGLNPMLAYSQGGGNAPSGSSASSNSPSLGATATQANMTSAQVDNIEADTQNKITTNDQIKANTDLMHWTAEQTKKDIAKLDQVISNLGQEFENLRAKWMLDTSNQMLTDQMNVTEQLKQKAEEQRIRLLSNEVAISNPAADAARTTGAFAAHGRNISQGLTPLTDLMRFSPKPSKSQNKYPKKVKE